MHPPLHSFYPTYYSLHSLQYCRFSNSRDTLYSEPYISTTDTLVFFLFFSSDASQVIHCFAFLHFKDDLRFSLVRLLLQPNQSRRTPMDKYALRVDICASPFTFFCTPSSFSSLPSVCLSPIPFPPIFSLFSLPLRPSTTTPYHTTPPSSRPSLFSTPDHLSAWSWRVCYLACARIINKTYPCVPVDSLPIFLSPHHVQHIHTLFTPCVCCFCCCCYCSIEEKEKGMMVHDSFARLFTMDQKTRMTTTRLHAGC